MMRNLKRLLFFLPLLSGCLLSEEKTFHIPTVSLYGCFTPGVETISYPLAVTADLSQVSSVYVEYADFIIEPGLSQVQNWSWLYSGEIWVTASGLPDAKILEYEPPDLPEGTAHFTSVGHVNILPYVQRGGYGTFYSTGRPPGANVVFDGSVRVIGFVQ